MDMSNELQEVKGYQFCRYRYRYKYHRLEPQTEDLIVEFYEHERMDEKGMKVKNDVILWFEDGPYSFESKSIATSLVEGSKDMSYLTGWTLKRQLTEKDSNFIFEPLHKKFVERLERWIIK